MVLADRVKSIASQLAVAKPVTLRTPQRLRPAASDLFAPARFCNRGELLSAFQMVSGVVPSRSPKPILQNVKLVAEEENTFLLATDLEVGIRYKR